MVVYDKENEELIIPVGWGLIEEETPDTPSQISDNSASEVEELK